MAFVKDRDKMTARLFDSTGTALKYLSIPSNFAKDRKNYLGTIFRGPRVLHLYSDKKGEQIGYTAVDFEKNSISHGSIDLNVKWKTTGLILHFTYMNVLHLLVADELTKSWKLMAISDVDKIETSNFSMESKHQWELINDLFTTYPRMEEITSAINHLDHAIYPNKFNVFENMLRILMEHDMGVFLITMNLQNQKVHFYNLSYANETNNFHKQTVFKVLNLGLKKQTRANSFVLHDYLFLSTVVDDHLTLDVFNLKTGLRVKAFKLQERELNNLRKSPYYTRSTTSTFGSGKHKLVKKPTTNFIPKIRNSERLLLTLSEFNGIYELALGWHNHTPGSFGGEFAGHSQPSDKVGYFRSFFDNSMEVVDAPHVDVLENARVFNNDLSHASNIKIIQQGKSIIFGYRDANTDKYKVVHIE